MVNELIIHAGIAELRFAVLSDGVLSRYWQDAILGDAGDGPSHVGDIVWGRVRRLLPAAEAAFVDIGQSRAGFLSVRDIRRAAPGKQPGAHIGDFVREGEAILVQVLKDPIGDKGARVGTEISLAGRLLVYAPYGSGVHVSRSIADDATRTRLIQTVAVIRGTSGGSFVVRTAASEASEEALRREAFALIEKWRGISATSESASAPAILHRELPPLEKALRDNAHDVLRVVFDGAEALAAARVYCEQAMPEFASKIVAHDSRRPLFEDLGIEDEIASLASSRVELKAGGWLMIEHTEALTAIDVNSGKIAHVGDGDSASLAVNLEAAEEIARQLALRGIGGLIVIDFIGTSDPEHRNRLVTALGAAMGRGGVPADIAAVPGGGPVVMTRKRTHDSLDRRLAEPCAVCDGHGRRRTASAVAHEILRRAEHHASAAPGKPVIVYAAPEIAAWLDARASILKPALARRGAADFRIVAEPARARETYSVETA